jgi:glycerol-3-phosphate acyltransferase PlsY
MMPTVILMAYAIGSIPFALLIARWWGAGDLRGVGSGNLGATNVWRASGVTAGLLVALLDIAKGAASVTLARHMTDQPAAPAAAGLAAIVGHIYPVWLRFHGGKGVATAAGVFAVLTPTAMGPVLTIFAITVVMTRYVSLGSVLGALALPPVVYLVGNPPPVVGAALAASILIVLRHRSNLSRLRTGAERRLGFRETTTAGTQSVSDT